jgi:hypothetical protein
MHNSQCSAGACLFVCLFVSRLNFLPHCCHTAAVLSVDNAGFLSFHAKDPSPLVDFSRFQRPNAMLRFPRILPADSAGCVHVLSFSARLYARVVVLRPVVCTCCHSPPVFFCHAPANQVHSVLTSLRVWAQGGVLTHVRGVMHHHVGIGDVCVLWLISTCSLL